MVTLTVQELINKLANIPSETPVFIEHEYVGQESGNDCVRNIPLCDVRLEHGTLLIEDITYRYAREDLRKEYVDYPTYREKAIMPEF